MSKIIVKDFEITVVKNNNDDYISLTDMIKAKDGNFFIADWLRNRNTLEFLLVWEQLYNPNFNYGEFALIKNQSGLNSFKVSVKEWVEKTGAIGIMAKTGRYGGTYAHKDIAFEFGTWISPSFKLYLIREFQRLKDLESKSHNLEWDFRRFLAKVNYRKSNKTEGPGHTTTKNIAKHQLQFSGTKPSYVAIPYLKQRSQRIIPYSNIPLKNMYATEK